MREIVSLGSKKKVVASDASTQKVYFSRILFIVATEMLSLSKVFKFSKNFRSLNIFNEALQ